MAIFNAWCDRTPVVVLGATGPVDAAKRRPWIDWIHTARDQGAIVRDYTKWDDQPASPAAAREAIMRANWIANTAPMGPVYINLDAEMQESKLAEPLPPIDVAALHAADRRPPPSPELVKQAADAAQRREEPGHPHGPGRRAAWRAGTQRVALAETLNAKVITELKLGAALPDRSSAACRPARLDRARAARRRRRCKAADVILSLDWVDLAGAFKGAFPDGVPAAKVIVVSNDFRIHRGWSMDYQGLPVCDVLLPTTPEEAVPDLLKAVGGAVADAQAARRRSPPQRRNSPRTSWWSTISCGRSRSRSASATSRSRISRCHGTAPPGRSAIRSTMSAPRAAAASAAARAMRSAPRSR